MSDIVIPRDEAELAALVTAANRAREPFAIEGNGSKRAMLRPVQSARTLSTRGLTGITLYRPTELVVSVRAGTLLSDLEAALAEQGQMLAPEPPYAHHLFGADAPPPTIGGIVATNLSGPRRIVAGAIRDHLLGIRFVNGAGEVHHNGGRVLKNVTGLDLCKLLCGSHGTLGVITEVTLKVLPRPESIATVVLPVADVATGVRVLSAGLGSPYGVTGAALRDDQGKLVALLRLEDFAAFLPGRADRLRSALADFGAAEVLDHAASGPVWIEIRNAEPLAQALAGRYHAAETAIWRVSVRPSAAAAVAAALARSFDARLLFDWGGGLIWVGGPATDAAHAAVVTAVNTAGGTFLLVRAPDALRAAVPVIPEEPPALSAIGARVKAALDPAGLFNPGRMRAGA